MKSFIIALALLASVPAYAEDAPKPQTVEELQKLNAAQADQINSLSEQLQYYVQQKALLEAQIVKQNADRDIATRKQPHAP